jgi:hypothetical protein
MLDIIRNGETVEEINDFVLVPIISEIFETKSDFSTAYELLENIFTSLEIDNGDKQEEFVETNSWICQITLVIKKRGYGEVIEVYADTLENLSLKVLKELERIKQ